MSGCRPSLVRPYSRVHGDKPRTVRQVTENLIQRLIAELRPGAAEQDHVRRRRVAAAGERQPCQVFGDVAAAEQQASRPGWWSRR